jgi:amidase
VHPNKRPLNNSSGYNRRDFLKVGLSGGALVAAFLHLPGSEKTLIPQGPSSDTPPFELDEITIAELGEGMQSGKYTARSVAEKYLARIQAVDTQGPSLNSIIELNPDALAIADELDKERKEKGARGPMHGIPVLIKDNIDTADRMATTAWQRV